MSKSNSFGHILLVRRHSFIPTYFSRSEFQLAQNTRDCDDNNSDETPVDESESHYDEYYHYNEETLQAQLSDSQASIPSLLQFLASYQHIYEIQTTRLRGSALANLFSCNVSKMTNESKSKLDCDGYFGCPEDKKMAKDHGKNACYYFNIILYFSSLS